MCLLGVLSKLMITRYWVHSIHRCPNDISFEVDTVGSSYTSYELYDIDSAQYSQKSS